MPEAACGWSRTAALALTVCALGRTRPRWIAGAATPEQADVAVVFTIPTLARADDRLTGRAEISAKLTGTLEHPGATARSLSRTRPRWAGRCRGSLSRPAKDIRGALDAHVTLDGEIDRKPARGDLHVTRQAGGGTSTVRISRSARLTFGATLSTARTLPPARWP